MTMTYQEREAREQARTDEMHALFAGIAALMPDWKIKPTEELGSYRSYVLERGEMAIHISRDQSGKCDKVNIGTWAWPKYTYRDDGMDKAEIISPSSLYDPRESSPSISCSISRGAEGIVKDIKKRFLPEYERIYARCEHKARVYQDHRQKSRAAWEAVCNVIGKSPDRGVHYFGRLNITNRSEGAKVELDVNAAQLATLIQALGIKDKER